MSRLVGSRFYMHSSRQHIKLIFLCVLLISCTVSVDVKHHVYLLCSLNGLAAHLFAE